MVSYISELRHVYLLLEEIMCSLCVLNELLYPLSLRHSCTDPGLQLGDPAPLIGLLLSKNLQEVTGRTSSPA